MKERGIGEADVEYCLKNYHTCYNDLKGNRIYRADLPNGKHIKVVLNEGSEPVIVITVAD